MWKLEDEAKYSEQDIIRKHVDRCCVTVTLSCATKGVLAHCNSHVGIDALELTSRLHLDFLLANLSTTFSFQVVVRSICMYVWKWRGPRQPEEIDWEKSYHCRAAESALVDDWLSLKG